MNIATIVIEIHFTRSVVLYLTLTACNNNNISITTTTSKNWTFLYIHARIIAIFERRIRTPYIPFSLRIRTSEKDEKEGIRWCKKLMFVLIICASTRTYLRINGTRACYIMWMKWNQRSNEVPVYNIYWTGKFIGWCVVIYLNRMAGTVR